MAQTIPEGSTVEAFKAELAKHEGKVVVVDFYAVWCGPCKMIAPKIEEYQAANSTSVVLLKVNVDDCEDIAADMGISAMPTFHIYKNGNKVDELVGANFESLKSKIEAQK